MRIPGTPFSDDTHVMDEIRKTAGARLYDFIKRIAVITDADLKKNHSVSLLFANTVEELGEYVAAKTVEDGHKRKKLKESALVEAIDVAICSLSLVFANGGTIEDLCNTGHEKLNKWDERVK